MDKYGISPDDVTCQVCKGDGCKACGFTGRISGCVDPVKEAESLRKQFNKEKEIGHERNFSKNRGSHTE